MKPRGQVIVDIEAALAKPVNGLPDLPWGFACIDGRDMVRLAAWIPAEDWPRIGVKLAEDAVPREPEAWTREAIIEQLEHDVAFGFEKALDKRGISAELMWTVVRMWLWVLEHPLRESRDYPQYGLPLFKAVALEFGYPNPIGEKQGTEFEYSADGP